MSARNHTNCPVCSKRNRKERDRLHTAASKAYGKVTAEEYARLLAKTGELPPLEDTLGEYYQHWFDVDGTFKMKYFVSCNVCGFEFTHIAEVPNAVKE